MSISSSSRALLDACATAMARGTVDTLDLFTINREFSANKDEIIRVLAFGVEKVTDTKRTVKEADSALFNSHVMGPALYIVVCDISKNERQVVTELADDMVLYVVGPYSNGFSLGQRAPVEEVSRYRALVSESHRRNNQRLKGEGEIEKLLTRLYESVKMLASECTDPVRKSDAEYALRNSGPNVSLENIAEACVALNIFLKDFMIASLNKAQ